MFSIIQREVFDDKILETFIEVVSFKNLLDLLLVDKQNRRNLFEKGQIL